MWYKFLVAIQIKATMVCFGTCLCLRLFCLVFKFVRTIENALSQVADF